MSSHNNTTETSSEQVYKDGYDLPVYGVEDDTFYYIHVPAIICIVASFCSVIAVLLLSFRRQSFRKFFQWSKSERFVVYLAICDGGYNVFHGVDHLNIVIVKNHVYPKELCEFYGFMLAVFIMGQNLMVNVAAINAFLLMYFDKNIDFGRADWRLLSWTFGVPFLGAVIAGSLGTLGPNGAFCYFDGVNGGIANLLFTTVPLLIILVMNVIMYVLTWKKIQEQSKSLRRTLSNCPKHLKKRSFRVAKTMSFFVLAFFIQWWSMALLGVWLMVGEVPQTVHHFVTTLTNLGGVFNLIVYVFIRREARSKSSDNSTDSERQKQKTSLELRTSNTETTDVRDNESASGAGQ